MKTDYRFIHMEEMPTTGKTKAWFVMNNSSNDPIGEIKWYPGWRQYCFMPYMDTVYSAGCLENISEFIVDAVLDHKKRFSRKSQILQCE